MFTGIAKLGILVVVLLLVCSTTVLPKEPEEIWQELGKLSGEERQKYLVSKAKEEGEVSWYTSLAPDVIETWRNDFETRYPGVKLKVWRGRGEAMSGRMLTEARAGKFGVDVASGATEFFPLLRKANVVGRYVSPEREFYLSANKDRDGLWTNGGNVLTVIVYNTDMVPKVEAPKSYDDFLNPKWKGSFAIDTNPDRVVMGWLKLWGSEKTEQVLQALMKNGAAVRSGHSLMAQLLCAGEFKAAIELYAHRTAELKEKGCPLEMVFPNPTLGSVGPLFVAKRAPHPHGAALLVDYLLSASGQKILVDKRHHSGRQGVKVNDPELDLEKRGVTTLLLSPEDMSQLEGNYFELRKRYLLIR
jgi:iron(III) transport system substrate-binding protein